MAAGTVMLETGKAFYLSLEDGIREPVRALRDAGLNTVCSCHHEGYIQINSSDPTHERRQIWNVMHELGIEYWTMELHVTSLGTWDFWELRSPKFIRENTDAKQEEK